jgi:cobalt-zinc-cadmium efflux system membrane fusion protein
MPDSEPDMKSSGPRARLATEARAVHPLARGHRMMTIDRSPLRRLTLGAAAVAALGIVVLIAYLTGVFGDQEAAAPRATPAAATSAAKPAAATAGTITLTEAQMGQIKVGVVEARTFWDEKTAVGQIALNEDATTPIFPPYPGRVTRLFPRPGDTVKPGDPLFEIDSPDLVQAESTLIAASATLQKARSQLDLTTRALARQRELFQAKASAQKDLEQAEADQRGAESDFRSATGALAAAQDAVRIFGKTDAEISRIKEQRRIDPVMPVIAPIGGTVVMRKAGPGQYVQPSNSDPVYTIADLSHMWLVANVGELDIPYVHLGDQVSVKVAAYPHETFHARITNIGAVVDPTTRRVTVRSEIEPMGYQLKPQMFASFRIITDAGTPSPAVPAGALTRDGDKATVWVLTGPRQFAARAVERGVEQESMAQILSGVAVGETVVTEGGVYLSNVTPTAGK